MSSKLNRISLLSTGAAIAASSFFSSPAFAVPSDNLAWGNEKLGITVYSDELDSSLYWYLPKIGFESNSGKTALVRSTLADGKIGYNVRIIPYFPDSFKALVMSALNLHDERQLRPIVATNIGFSLADYPGYKYMSEAGVTNFQYIDVPRRMRFSLDPADAEFFDEDFQKPKGVPVEFTLSYNGVIKKNFYKIGASCRNVQSALEYGTKQGSGIGVSVGNVHAKAEIEAAVKTAISNINNGVDIVSKGENADLTSVLSQVMTLCFTPVLPDANGDYDNGTDYNNDGTTPKVEAKVRFKFKKSSIDNNVRTDIKSVNQTDSVSNAVLMGNLTANSSEYERIVSTTQLQAKAYAINTNNSKSAPFETGLKIPAGVKLTIQAELALKLFDKLLPTVDPTVQENVKGDLYYRIGNGQWQPVNGYLTVSSDIGRGNETLQFAMDYSSVKGKLPNPKYHLVNRQHYTPQFRIQVTGQRISSK